MIAVSDKWKDIQQRFLLPETYIEIDCAITDTEAQGSAVGVGVNEEFFSNVATVLDSDENITMYATNELNLWALDGTQKIALDAAPYEPAGYVSNTESSGSIVLTFSRLQETAVAGVTITWGESYGEYPSVFTVSAKKGNTVAAETTVTNNISQTSVVSLKLVNYDSIVITVHSWVLPYRRARIENVAIGHMLTLTKNDILSFTHEMHGDLMSGEIPKYSIEFTMDNSDGRWDPNNPQGIEQFLAERQKLTVRYGLDINGIIEWIPAGTFYLSEWNIPSNGLEARFVARDVFEFLLNVDMKGARYGTLDDLAKIAMLYQLPEDAAVSIDPVLKQYTGVQDQGNNTAAEIVQKCANAAQCILRYDRAGGLYIERLNQTLTDYRITQALSYSYPEITLSKPLKSVSVSYGGDNPLELQVSTEGEVQTVDNDFIVKIEQARDVAFFVRDILKTRQTVRGEFRADPRLDLYDVVTVEGKYGEIKPVVITNIKYTFNGALHGSYEGRVLEG